jgi:hypothetical protein
VSRRRLITVVAAAIGVAVVIALLIANRVRETPTADGPRPNSGPAITTPESTTSHGSESAPPGSAAPSVSSTANGPATTSSQGTDGCATGETILKWTPNQPPPDRTCVHVASDILLAMSPIDPDQWQQPTSSDPQIATVGPLGRDQEGITYTTVTTLHPGTVTIHATARPQEPNDPQRTGPLRQLWLLTITVIA